MDNISLLAIDLAKNVFQLHGLNEQGKRVLKKKLTRNKFIAFGAQLPKCTVVMECCGSAQYWGRFFQKQGHIVKLIAPQYVKPFVKGNKNDANDAEAIAEAASRPSMRFVQVKTIEQQDIQSIHRIRERYLKERISLSNQIRGILAEYGVIINKGFAHIKKEIPYIFENKRNKLSNFLEAEIEVLYNDLNKLQEKVVYYDKIISQLHKTHEVCKMMTEVEGVGPLTSTALLGIGDVSHLKNGRHFAAFLGLVPKEHSSGGIQRLGSISKRGNNYIRRLLIQGSRSVIFRIKNKNDAKSLWLQQLVKRRGINRATVALANKNARILWKILVDGVCYQPNLAVDG